MSGERTETAPSLTADDPRAPVGETVLHDECPQDHGKRLDREVLGNARCYRTDDRFVGEVDRLTERPVPEKLSDLRHEIRKLRRKLDVLRYPLGVVRDDFFCRLRLGDRVFALNEFLEADAARSSCFFGSFGQVSLATSMAAISSASVFFRARIGLRTGTVMSCAIFSESGAMVVITTGSFGCGGIACDGSGSGARSGAFLTVLGPGRDVARELRRSPWCPPWWTIPTGLRAKRLSRSSR